MLTKNERRYFKSSDSTQVLQSLQGTLYQWGIGMHQIGNQVWEGKGQRPSYGLVPKVGVTMSPAGQDLVCVDVRVTGDVDQSGVIILVVCWLFFFPAALIIMFMAHGDFTTKQGQLAYAMWTPLSNLMVQPPPMAAMGYQPGPAGPGR